MTSAVSEMDTHPGAVVRRLRRLHQLSQEQLAKRAGVNRSTLAHIERGAATPSYDTTQRLAVSLGVSACTFFTLPRCEALTAS